MATCVLIDGHSEAYRAYFAMLNADLTARRTGEPTGAVFGFMRQLLAVLRAHRPEYLVVAFDPPRTFREERFPAYKATRERMPDELGSQIQRIQALLDAMGIRRVTQAGYEADDVIGTLATRAAEDGMDVFVKTGDRDLFQLATDRIRILYTAARRSAQADQPIDAAAVAAMFGVDVAQFIHMKALQGDKSDNIPGVPGVGEKSAVKLVRQFGSVDRLYARLDELSGPKLKENLRAHRAQVELNLELVTIVRDLDFAFAWDEARMPRPDTARVADLLRSLDLHSTLNEFNAWFQASDSVAGGLFPSADAGAESRAARYACIQTPDQLQDLARKLAASPVLAFDFETSSSDPLTAALVGLAVSWDAHAAAYVPLGHQQGEQLAWADVRAALAPAFAAPDKALVAHNAKYDLLMARRHDLAVGGALHDTMIQAWVLDPGRRHLGLKDLARDELGAFMQPIKDLIGTGRKRISMGAVSIDKAAPYASDDAAQTWLLHRRFRPQLAEAGLETVYADIELPLIPILADMETRGVMLDPDFLQALQGEFAARLQTLAERMNALVGYAFNLRSTQQLSRALFDVQGLQLPTTGLKRLKAGGYSTAAGVLEDLAKKDLKLDARQSEALGVILEFRQLDKLKGTYVDPLLAMGDTAERRVHTSFNQAGAATGRMSSNNPNLQNIPIRTEEGRRLRRAFVAPPDRLLMAADYNQIELRVLAHVADEPGLVQAFRDDQDIHAATAAELFKVPLAAVTRAQRGLAKTINFATVYGVTAFGLSTRSEMSFAEAEEFLHQYFRTYPQVEQYVKDTVSQVTAHGYVETLVGRKCRFVELQNPHFPAHRRGSAERAAINAPIQGSAADIIKIAMRELETALTARTLQGRMLLTVHDELVLETPRAELWPLAALTRDVMEGAYELKVPLKVDLEAGDNWRELKPVSWPQAARA